MGFLTILKLNSEPEISQKLGLGQMSQHISSNLYIKLSKKIIKLNPSSSTGPKAISNFQEKNHSSPIICAEIFGLQTILKIKA